MIPKAGKQKNSLWIFSRCGMALLLGFLILQPPKNYSSYAQSRAVAEEEETVAEEEKTKPDLPALEPGESIAREIAGGESSSYLIELKAGEYLEVIVEQKGIDLAVTLFGTDDKELASIDSPNGPQGIEQIVAIAENPGNYRLEIYAYGFATSGSYNIKIENLREATIRDRNRTAAQTAFVEARQLAREKNAESRQQAIEKYQEALGLFRELSDRYWEANILYNMADLYYKIGDKPQAFEYFEDVLPIRQALGDRYGEARTIDAIANSYLLLGDRTQAIDYYNRVLPLWRSLEDPIAESQTFTNLGLAYYYLGEYNKALENYYLALPIIKKMEDKAGEAYAFNNIGLVYWAFGDADNAIESYNRALALARETGTEGLEAQALSQIGLAYDSLEQPEKSLGYYQLALEIYQAAGDASGEALTLSNIGSAYSSMGQPRKALEYYNQAQKTDKGNRSGQAITLNQMARLYSELGEYRKALEVLNEALPLSLAVGDRPIQASVLYSIAAVEREKGNLQEGLARIEAAIAIVEDLRVKLTSQKLRTSYFASKQDYYELYIDLLMLLHKQQPEAGFDGKALQASERARARSLLEILNEAKADIRQGVDPELLRQEQLLEEQLDDIEKRRIELFGSGNADQAKKAALAKETEALLKQSEELQAHIRVNSPRYAALTQPQPLSLEEIQEQVLDKETLLLEYSLGEKRSYLWAVTKDSIRSYELPPREEIEKAAREFRTALTAPTMRIRQQKVAAITEALGKLVLAPVASQLGDKRLAIVSDGALQYIPFGALLVAEESDRTSPRENNSQNLVPLIVRHEIVNLPSASTVAVLRRDLGDRQIASKTVAILADPVFNTKDDRVKGGVNGGDETTAEPEATEPEEPELQPRARLETRLETKPRPRTRATLEGTDWTRLPGTRQEAEAIMALVPESQREQVFDFQATLERVTSPAIGDYRIIHFATHGFANSVHPELSGIVMSLVDEKGAPQNGYLRLREIYNLNLPAELVVLSACQTGLGKQIRGEGLVGLTRGFMYAGSPRVVVSLWSVNDEATAELMSIFYRNMLQQRLTPAAALRNAQIQMWKQKKWQSPYYWAAFELQGEWDSWN